MANTFTLSGTFKDAKNNPLYVGRYVRFLITSTGTDGEDQVAYPQDPISWLIDENGDFGGEMWINGDSGVECFYKITEPSGQVFQVIIPSSEEGNTVRYEYILENYQTEDSSQQDTTLGAAKAYTDQEVAALAADPSSNVAFDPAVWKTDLNYTASDFGLGSGDDVTFKTITTSQTASSSDYNIAFATDTGFRGIGAGSLDFGYFRNDLLQWASSATGMYISPPLTLGTDLAITEGGTGASTAADARTNLDAQQQSDDLDDIAALTPSQYDVIEYDGANWASRDGQIQSSSVIIRQASDLPTTIDGTKVYVIDGSIDMTGEASRTITSAGAIFKGSGASGSGFTSTTAAQTLFVSDVGGAGTVVFDGLSISTTGAGSSVFNCTDATGQNIFAIQRSAFILCDSIGEIDGYGIVIHDSSQHISCTQGITLSGTMINVDFRDGAFTGAPSGAIEIAEGTSLSITGRFLLESFTATIASDVTLSDIQGTNIVPDAGHEVLFNSISGAGTFFSNLNGDNVKCRWRDNNFDPVAAESNTYVGGAWKIDDAADEVANTVSPTTYSKINGTTTPTSLNWFSAGTANDLTYDSGRSVKAEITGVLYFTGTNNQTIQVKVVADDGTPVDVDELGAIEFISTGAPTAYPIEVEIDLDTAATTIELHAKTSSGSFTMKDKSRIILKERAN